MIYLIGGAGTFVLLSTLVFDLYDILVRYPRTIEAYRADRYEVVAGCLNGFDPSPVVGHTPDAIRVDGRTFSYADSYITGPGFHQTEARGGPIHPDTWVRLFLVGNSIVRVDVAPGVCPAAPRFAVSGLKP